MKTEEAQRFQQIILVHLDAAYNYAYYLTRHQQDAEDLVQESCRRAFAAFDRFEQTHPKSWLLTIIRHTFLNQKIKEQKRGEVIYLDNTHLEINTPDKLKDNGTPEQMMMQSNDAQYLHHVVASLPDDYREVIILRELEELSYADIAKIMDCAIGTVMSRLSRARLQLKKSLRPEKLENGGSHEL